MVPVTLLGQFVAAAVVAGSLVGLDPDGATGGLARCLALGLCVVRSIRAYRLRVDVDYARRKPADARSITWVITILATLWLVPPLFWSAQVDLTERVILFLVGMGLMSVGIVTLTTLPRAMLNYVLLLGAGNLVMAIQLGNKTLIGLTILYVVAVIWILLTVARRFFAQVRSRYDLEERGELVSLLREFEASGSGGIWELDAKLNMTHVSDELAERLGSQVGATGRTQRLHAARSAGPDRARFRRDADAVPSSRKRRSVPRSRDPGSRQQDLVVAVGKTGP